MSLYLKSTRQQSYQIHLCQLSPSHLTVLLLHLEALFPVSKRPLKYISEVISKICLLNMKHSQSVGLTCGSEKFHHKKQRPGSTWNHGSYISIVTALQHSAQAHALVRTCYSTYLLPLSSHPDRLHLDCLFICFWTGVSRDQKHYVFGFSIPLSWMRYLRKFLQIWYKRPLGLKAELIIF